MSLARRAYEPCTCVRSRKLHEVREHTRLYRRYGEIKDLNVESLLAALGAFVNDPLINWRLISRISGSLVPFFNCLRVLVV